MPLKILHLLSERRFTGPAEPVLQLCRALIAHGHDVQLAYRKPQPVGDHPKKQYKTLRLQRTIEGYQIPATTRFALDRYRPWTLPTDALALRRFIRDEKFDVVHAHLSHDHALAVMACAGLRRPVTVRSLHQRDVLPASPMRRLILPRSTDGLATPTPGFAQAYARRFNLAPDRIAAIWPVMDFAPFEPAEPWKDMRAEFGLSDDAIVVGIVARYQAYRRTDVFMEAARIAVDKQPRLRFLVVGGSSQFEKTVLEPVRELGLQDYVIRAGYRTVDYLDTLAAMDIPTLLTPGADGTARYIREAMALGKPVVATDRGMLPELVPHEKAGLVVPLDAQQLADAWLRLAEDRQLAEQLGRGAYDWTRQAFTPEPAAEAATALYEKLLAR